MFALLIKNLIIIGIIGGVVFASQSAAFRPTIENMYSRGVKSENSYIAKTTDWVKDTIYPKLGGVSGPLTNGETSLAQRWGGEVAKTQASLQEGIVEQKNNLVENSTNATKKIIAEKFLQFLGITPQELGSCPATPTN